MERVSVQRVLLHSVLLLLTQVSVLTGETVLGVANDEFDFDGLPGAHHEFKVHIPPHTEECFFQAVGEGASLHVNMQVLIGGNKKVDFYVWDPHGQPVHKSLLNSTYDFKLESAPAEGTYAACVDNTYKYDDRLVYVFMVTFKMAEWEEFHEELQGINLLADSFKESLVAVEASLSAARKAQEGVRRKVARDWYLAQGNIQYVDLWSVAQCVLVVVAAVGQVYFFRNMFTSARPLPAKPRA